MKRNWGGFYAPYIGLVTVVLLVGALIVREVVWNNAARSPGVFTCAFDGRETLRVRVAEGWKMPQSRGWMYLPYGARRPTTYWPLGGETCEIQR